MLTLADPLLSILRAAHCRSTHHFMALDALPLIAAPPGRRLAKILLAHHVRYLTGAKDPDTRFRDFQNHVVHVDDGYWGGAPRVAHQWYQRMQRYLRERRYGDAAHAAGVLSHYFTDPIQPLHTAQSPVEKVLHRPIEWSINRSYGDLIDRWRRDPHRTLFQLSDREGWLGDAILHAARVAHGGYGSLLEQFDLIAARSNPTAGLNDSLRDMLGDLIGLAVTGWARVLERAAWEHESAHAVIPAHSLTLPMVMATVRVPHRVWRRRIENRAQRRRVDAMIEEFRATGDVCRHLPSEQRVIGLVRKIRHREKDFRARRELAAKLAQAELAAAPTGAPATPDVDDAPILLPFQAASLGEVPGSQTAARLTVSDPLVDAPSIGPKTAARFTAVDIGTVGDFLRADPAVLHRRLATRWITLETLVAWRHQALLMCQMPGMLARDTQLLVACGFTSVELIAAADNKLLHGRIVEHSETSAGARSLRGAEPPSIEIVSRWIADAALCVVQQKRALAIDSTRQSEPATDHGGSTRPGSTRPGSTRPGSTHAA